LGVNKFYETIKKSAYQKQSRIILALDIQPSGNIDYLSNAINLVENLNALICAVKVNRHLTLPLGLGEEIHKILKLCNKLKLPTIMDCKINDIGSTNKVIARHYFEIGFDALTANPFVGWEDGLQSVFEMAETFDKGVLLLVYMSHKGSWEGYGIEANDPLSGKTRPLYHLFAEKALTWGAEGAVVGATYPEKIQEVYDILGNEVPIYSPGIGVQGGRVKLAVSSGATYLIVGRSIIRSNDPVATAEELKIMAGKPKF
jgi:orotidine-5'-phosphate decarboxylase